jgi:hypothetical protein
MMVNVMTKEEAAHELNHFFIDELSFCCCGCPASVAVLIRDVLRLCPLYDHRSEFDKLLPTYGIQYFVLYILDKADLIEHGGTVGGAWLTAKGEKLRADLEAVSIYDPELNSLFPDSPEGPPESCQKCYPPELDRA